MFAERMSCVGEDYLFRGAANVEFASPEQRLAGAGRLAWWMELGQYLQGGCTWRNAGTLPRILLARML
jgi:hypothetical protein